jgi:hypothetical protein
MVRTRMRLAPLLALALLAAPGAAEARPNPALWATINRCDTPTAPNSVGVRAAMPGDATRQRMYVRFTAQFFSHKLGRWLTAAGSDQSPWLYVGLARYRSLQAGWIFPFAPPPQGTVFRVRALAEFEWRARRRVGRRRHARWTVTMRRKRVTQAGVRGADGGDPAGSSRGSCDIA